MSRDLRAEVLAFLAEHGPSRTKDIALGVRARLKAVQAVLSQDGFSQAERPEGAHPLCVYYTASPRIPRITEGSRSWTLLSILKDGGWHTREEILAAAGRSFLTNNAAAELRRADHVVEFSAKRGYRLVSLAAPEGPPGLLVSPSGAVSDRAVVSLAAPEVSPSPSSASGAASETRERVAA